MLPKGSITKIHDYYFTTPRYGNEILRAMREFLNRQDLDSGNSMKLSEKSNGFFNEWFLYDFVLTNGKTILADFVAENPFELSATDIMFYKDLLMSNVFGIFEAISIDIDIGLMLKNLQTEKMLYVYEQKLTSQVKRGSVFFGRTGKVGNHYELIGADTFSLGELNDSVKKSFRGMKFKITPKEAYVLWEDR